MRMLVGPPSAGTAVEAAVNANTRNNVAIFMVQCMYPGCEEVSQTSEAVATSSFMLDHIRPPGTDDRPRTAARANAIMRTMTRSFSSSGQVSTGCPARTTI